MLLDLCERYAVAAIIGATRSKRDLAAGKRPPDDLRDLADSIILRVITDVERFAAHGFPRRLQRTEYCLADVFHVNQWPAGCAITHHPHFSGREGKSSQIVEHE